jgi:acetylornithine deacetylase/succinyl-diaminopimelate desuccinylase-like protein
MNVEQRKVVEAVLRRIEDAREDIAELALRLGNTNAPFGEESGTSKEVRAWYQENGMQSRWLEIIPGRANVVARIPAAGASRAGRASSLLFNAHLDTEVSGPDYDNLMQAPDINGIGGWREGDRLFGHTVLNDRGCMAIFMVAGRALQQAKAPLGADVILTSVVGETGAAPVDEYQGLRYEGKGFGSTYLVSHGIRADYALVAETTGNAICWYNCGANYYKITLRGQNMYTPRLIRGESLAEHPNAIVKAAAVIQAIEVWAVEFEARRTGPTPCGIVAPKAQVGAVRGGIPWRPNRSATYTALYVDVRTLPGEDPDEVTASLRQAVDAVGVGAEVELIMCKPGVEGQATEPLVRAIRAAHRFVRAEDPPAQAETAVVSMWRDTNIFNGAGIPSVTFGPSRGKADVQGRGHFELDDLIAGAKMYALTALQLAGGIDAAELVD